MKEAFGGTFTLKLVMVFFVIYVTFLGVALNIAKAYRIKNHVINILEQKQFSFDTSNQGNNADITITEIGNYLVNVPYSTTAANIKDRCEKTAAGKKHNYATGVCIIEEPGNYFKVIVYMYIEFPFIMREGMVLPISGETMTIIKD